MVDNVPVTPGSGKIIATDELTDAILGTVQVQYVKIMDGTIDSSTKAAVDASGLAVKATQTGTWNVNQAGTWTVTQSGTWTIQAVQSGVWNIGQSGTWTVQSVQSGAWTVAATQSAAWNVGQTGTWTVQPGNTPNLTPWLFKLSDATNSVAIKGASTAPAATDPALVVALSPNGLNANGAATGANSAPVVVATNQATIAIAQDTTQIAVGVSGTTVTPTKVRISIASATTTTLVAAVAAKKIRVLGMYLISTGANTINLQSHTTTSNSDGLPAYAANGGIVLPFNPIGWFDTIAGEALDMVTSAGTQVSGQLSYVAV